MASDSKRRPAPGERKAKRGSWLRPRLWLAALVRKVPGLGWLARKLEGRTLIRFQAFHPLPEWIGRWRPWH